MTVTIHASAILCDDIRREDNGKIMVIGAYDHSLVPGAMPSNFPVALWISVVGLSEGKYKCRIKLEYPKGNEFGTEGELRVHDDSGRVSMFLVGVPVNLQDYGKIRGTIFVGEYPEVEFLNLPVIPSPSPSPSPSP